MSDILQIAIGLVIVGLVLWTVQRHGRDNPEGTGKLSRQIAKVVGDIRRIEERMEDSATKAELGVLSGEIRALEQRTATSAEVAALDAKLAAIAKAADRTEEGVQRIEGILIKKALES